MKDYDIIIIGAGIIGSCIAYNLVKDDYKGKILVLDKDTAAGEESSTALSAGGFRNIWTTPVNMKLSTYSINEYEKLQEEVDIGLDKAGYLFLKNKNQWEQAKELAKEQERNGVNVDILSLKEVRRLVPSLEFNKIEKDIKEFFGLEDIVGGIYGLDCGFIEPYMLSRELLNRARNEGVELKERTEVLYILKKGNEILGVKTKEDVYNAPIVVNAAGPYAAKIAKTIHVDLPIIPTNRQLFSTTNTYGVKFPMIVLDNGAYMRSDGDGLLFGRANKEEPKAKELKGKFLMHCSKQYFLDKIYPYFLARLPKLERGTSIKGKWGGLYSINKEDHNAVIGEHPEIKGFYMCCGFSGHGVMEGYAAGKCISDLIIKGDYVTIPEAKQLRFKRFKEEKLIKELEVI